MWEGVETLSNCERIHCGTYFAPENAFLVPLSNTNSTIELSDNNTIELSQNNSIELSDKKTVSTSHGHVGMLFQILFNMYTVYNSHH